MSVVLHGVRKLKIGKRLLAAFGLIVALIVVITIVGVIGGNAQSNAASQLMQSQRFTHEAMQVKFRGADFNGWQTAYAFDVIRGLPNATSDSSPSRASFLASAASFRKELATLDKERQTPAENTATAAVKRAFDQFMATDTQVISLYRQGTPAALKAANALVLGREITLFNQVSTDSDKLVALAQARGVSRRRRSREQCRKRVPHSNDPRRTAHRAAGGRARAGDRALDRTPARRSSSTSASGSPRATSIRRSTRPAVTRSAISPACSTACSATSRTWPRSPIRSPTAISAVTYKPAPSATRSGTRSQR